MKHRISFIGLVSALVFSATVSAQRNADPSFEITGILTANKKKISDFQVILSYNGKAEDTVAAKSGKKVFITLKRNEIYSLIFRKEGFAEKMIIINTALPKSVDTEEPFNLNVEIELDPSLSKQKTEMSDFPIGYVKYEKKEDDFNFSSTYHGLVYLEGK
jgi:hypothetical protein